MREKVTDTFYKLGHIPTQNWNDLIKKSKELKETFALFSVHHLRWFKVKDMNK